MSNHMVLPRELDLERRKKWRVCTKGVLIGAAASGALCGLELAGLLSLIPGRELIETWGWYALLCIPFFLTVARCVGMAAMTPSFRRKRARLQRDFDGLPPEALKRTMRHRQKAERLRQEELQEDLKTHQHTVAKSGLRLVLWLLCTLFLYLAVYVAQHEVLHEIPELYRHVVVWLAAFFSLQHFIATADALLMIPSIRRDLTEQRALSQQILLTRQELHGESGSGALMMTSEPAKEQGAVSVVPPPLTH